MSSFSSQSLSELIAVYPAAAGLFDQYQLDYCCSGRLSLQEACNGETELIDTIRQALEISGERKFAAAGTDPYTLSPAALAEWITEQHHRYVRETGPSLALRLAKIAVQHGDRNPELHIIAYVFRQLQAELEQHMVKEEQVLFPWVESLCEDADYADSSRIQQPIRCMEIEHEFAATLTGELKRISNHFRAPESACDSWKAAMTELHEYVQDLQLHIHLENNILFPAALELVRSHA